MKHIILLLFVLFALVSCVKEEEDSPLLSAPVITLKEESPIYKTKIGREITIAPIYENTDSETTFNWTIDGKSICTTSTLTFSADEAGRYFILISATNAGGTTEKEIRIDVFQLDVPTISIADADKGFKVLQGSELTITPIVDSFLETSYSWQINGEDISSELTCTLPTIELGEYQVRFATHNEDGDDEVTFKVEVCSPDQVDFNWTFLQTEYNMSAGRTIRIKPVDVNNALDAVYTWTVDSEQVQSGENDTYLFTSEQQGEHTVREVFAPGEVDRIYLNFSDPWPPNRQRKRRLTWRAYLEVYDEILRQQGDLCFKTDNQRFFEWSLQEICQFGWLIQNISLDLHNSDFEGNVMTEYEEKFSAEGYRIYRLEARRRLPEFLKK